MPLGDIGKVVKPMLTVLNALLVDRIERFDNGRIDLIDIGLHRDLMFDSLPVTWEGMYLFFELSIPDSLRGQRVHVYFGILDPDGQVIREPDQFPVLLPTLERYDGKSLPFDYPVPPLLLRLPGTYIIRVHTSEEILRDVPFEVHIR